ncbi:LacI family DNA-binding transcriptional regulator [Vibrio sp. DW001]|uniref:LacI family DNA-binding transcriptional regulator n=1 Tax=Vibrio sp. DW001 TaxID=2912315 RepID=UPI0023B125D0|nr:LacI family DNA-binding transcriptional regulator [Vibrio sp. DW001]WED26749.1 LacI family DNA-binding transcriptional regulator [Vibrio sp. DW001]
MKKRTTIADIARVLNINKSTVSRALNNPDRVSDELHARVKETCRELHYIPNNAAKTLASASSKSIVLLVSSFTNSVFSEIIRTAKIECELLGYNLLIGDSSYTPIGEEAVIEKYLQQNVDGFILTETLHSSKAQNLIKQSYIPTIEIMDIIDSPTFDANIGVDQYCAAKEITHYLIEKKNRKNIAFCSTWLDRRAQMRKKAWESTMQNHGLESHRFVNIKEHSSFQNGSNGLVEILQRWPDTDAIFFVNDDMAAGAIMESQRCSIHVGRDLDIVGFNDLEYASVISPRLTTIRVPRVEMAKLAVTSLIDLIEGRPLEQTTQVLPYKLVIRESA